MPKLKRSFGSFLKYFLLILGLLCTVYPMYWMVYAGTYNAADTYTLIFRWLPGNQLMSNLKVINESFNMLRVLFNTFYVSIIGTVLSIIVNVMMGYALAKYEFKHKAAIFGVFMVTMFLGGASSMIPQFEIIKNMGLYNNLWAIILPSIYSTYTAFLAKQTLMDFPTEIMEASRIDGCGEIHIFWRIVVPNIRPTLATIAIITFMGYWNGYLWNLIVTSSVDQYTLQVALAAIYPTAAIWTYAPIKMLGAAISVIPILILFVALQKQFMNSITGAVKG